MKYILFLLAISFLSAPKCNKQSATIPSCIEQKIATIKAQPKWNPPAEINEYIYNDKRVFLFSSPCCDQYNMLYDENCTPLCAPSGGYTGKGDSQCADFTETAKLVRLVWKDDR